MEALLTVVTAALVAGLVIWGLIRMRGVSAPRRAEPWPEGQPPSRTVVLDLEVEDPDTPTVQRLVDEVGLRTLAAAPELDEVEVLDRKQQLLGKVRRPEPLADVALPEELREPHLRASRSPSPVRQAAPSHPHPPDAEVDPTVPDRPLADRFALPEAVRAAIRDPENPTELVAALLEAGGHEVTVDGNVVVVGDTAIVTVPDVRHGAEAALNHAFLRFQESGAARGIVLRLGYVNPAIIRRREAAAPNVRHVASDALQRMADAVELGADPLVFAAGPAVVR